MVQSEFNLGFLFVSYNIFLLREKVGPALHALSPLSPSRAQALSSLSGPQHFTGARYPRYI
jgi:hypothetical protein